MRKLSTRQRQFALEYRVDGNASRAALAAGYAETSGGTRGSKLLRLPAVKEFLGTFARKDIEAAGLSREFVITGLMSMTKSDAVSEKGKLEAFKQLSRFLGPQIPARLLDAGIPDPTSKAKAGPPDKIAAHVPDEGDDMRLIVSGAVKH